MLIGYRLPDMDTSATPSHNPGTKNEDLLNGLNRPGGALQLRYLFASFEYPDPGRRSRSQASPCCKNRVFPGIRRRDYVRCLRTSEEDKIKSTA